MIRRYINVVTFEIIPRLFLSVIDQIGHPSSHRLLSMPQALSPAGILLVHVGSRLALGSSDVIRW